MSDREAPNLVNATRLTTVCSDEEYTRECYDEIPGSQFVEPPEAN